jgi:hypothetical protein
MVFFAPKKKKFFFSPSKVAKKKKLRTHLLTEPLFQFRMTCDYQVRLISIEGENLYLKDLPKFLWL